MFIQIVSGISYMHDQHILHRDLKTANIFKTKHNCLKIGDFGVSKIMSTKFRKANTMIGMCVFGSTAAFLALEHTLSE